MISIFVGFETEKLQDQIVPYYETHEGGSVGDGFQVVGGIVAVYDHFAHGEVVIRASVAVLVDVPEVVLNDFGDGGDSIDFERRSFVLE